MYLKILKCSVSDFWYCDHIGEMFRLITLNVYEMNHLVTSADGYSNIVRIEDCEIVS